MNYNIQPMIETLVRNFNLVGVVMSHVTPIYNYRDTMLLITFTNSLRSFVTLS